MKRAVAIACGVMALAACRKLHHLGTSTTSPPSMCGFGPTDWCPSPAGDACGAHKDVASCRADARCEGMQYQGESVVACIDDARCFGSNCPTVGCLSRCETLAAADCAAQAPRCKTVPGGCARRVPCAPAATP